MTYGYNADERVTSVTDPGASTAISLSYDADQNRTQITFPNGTPTESMTYDPSEQLTGITGTSGGTTLTSFTYSYQNGSTPTDLRSSVTTPSGTTNYSYDPLDRLTAANSTSYGYDGAGNMTAMAGKTLSYNAANELTSAGSTTYSFDAAGQETGNSAGLSLGYNTAGQTTSLDGTSLGYTDTGQNTLTSYGSTTYQSDSTGVSVETSGGASSYFTRLPDGTILDQRTGGKTYPYLTDANDSVAAVTDSSGTVENTYSYDPWGNVTASEKVSNPIRFDGGLQIGSLDKFGARYYDPSVGRWTQMDPFPGFTGDPQSVNRYTFVRDNPVNLEDLLGLQTCGQWSNALSIIALQQAILSFIIPAYGVTVGGWVAGAATVAGGGFAIASPAGWC